MTEPKVSDYDIIRALEKRHLQKQNPDGFFVEVCIGTAGSRIAEEHDHLRRERDMLRNQLDGAEGALEELRRLRSLLARETGYLSPMANAAERLETFIGGRRDTVFDPVMLDSVTRARESLERLEAKFKEVEVAK